MKYSYSIFFILLMVSGCSNATSTNEPHDSEIITATQQDSYQKAKKYSEAGDKENYLQQIKNNEIPDPSIPDDIKILMQNDK